MVRSASLLFFSAILSVGCQERPQEQVRTDSARPSTVKRSEKIVERDVAEESPAVSQDTSAPPIETRKQVDQAQRIEPPARRVPKRPEQSKDAWTLFREPVDPDEDASLTSRWTGGNHFEVRTGNVKRVTIDMTNLPAKAPSKGPWVLDIDGQGIEITGFTPKPGYTGSKRDLVRSKNGVWSVDREALYRHGQ